VWCVEGSLLQGCVDFGRLVLNVGFQSSTDQTSSSFQVPFSNTFHFSFLDSVILCFELEDILFLSGYINFGCGFDFRYGNS
jgi:hypothetical protein